jgi:hypothetical protein
MALVALGVVICCSSMISSAYLVPFPASKQSSDNFQQVASGRVIYDKNGDAFKCGLESNCLDNCSIDSTCNSFSVWTQYGDVWCLKSKRDGNPFFSIPAYVVNKTDAKIYIKNK